MRDGGAYVRERHRLAESLGAHSGGNQPLITGYTICELWNFRCNIKWTFELLQSRRYYATPCQDCSISTRVAFCWFIRPEHRHVCLNSLHYNINFPKTISSLSNGQKNS